MLAPERSCNIVEVVVRNSNQISNPQSFRGPLAASQLGLTVAYLLTTAASFVTLIPLCPRGDLAFHLDSFSSYLLLQDSYAIGYCWGGGGS